MTNIKQKDALSDLISDMDQDNESKNDSEEKEPNNDKHEVEIGEDKVLLNFKKLIDIYSKKNK